MKQVMVNIRGTLKRISMRVSKMPKQKKAIATVALSFSLVVGVFATIISPVLNRTPSSNPWDYAVFAFGSGNALTSATNNLNVDGDIRSNGNISLSGNTANISGYAIASGNISPSVNTLTIGEQQENTNVITHNNVFDNVSRIADATVIYNMQTDSNLANLKMNSDIPFIRTAGSSGTALNVNMNSTPKTVTVTNRGGTSQGIRINPDNIAAVAKANHEYRIEYSGKFPNNPTAIARIRIENPTGETLTTAEAINGEFSVAVVRTAEQIIADAGLGLRYSLGNTSGKIDIIYTNIVITEIPPQDMYTKIYDMQNDSNLTNLNNYNVFPFIRGAGSSSLNFNVNMNSSPRTVTVTNRGGTSQGIQINTVDINAVSKANHKYKIEFSGRFPNNPTAIARIRIENPTGETLATAEAVDGVFTVSVTRTAAQIANDAQAGHRYSLGNTTGNIDIVYTGVTISEIPPPTLATTVYDMQTDTYFPALTTNGTIPFLRSAVSTGATFSVNANSTPRTVTVTNRSGTSQGIQIVSADINAIAKANHAYIIEFSGNFPNNPNATARIRIENPTGETLATADALLNGQFTLSVVRTAEQIAADAQAGLRYSLGNTSGNIDIVYTGITITEIPHINVTNNSVSIGENIVTDSTININVTNSASINASLLSALDIQINTPYFGSNATSISVIASQNGNIVINAAEIAFSGIIYAPNGKVTIIGSGIINGRIFAQEIEIISDTLTIIAGNNDISHLGFAYIQTDEPPAETTPATTAPDTTSTPPTTTNVVTESTTEPTTTVPETTTSTTPNTTSPEHSSTPPVTTEVPLTGYSDVDYEYDALGRLVRVNFDDENYILYEYDANGNITSVITVIDGIIQ